LAVALFTVLALAAFNRSDAPPAKAIANVRTVSLDGGESGGRGDQGAPSEPAAAGGDEVTTVRQPSTWIHCCRPPM
jgi:hypothetical protein